MVLQRHLAAFATFGMLMLTVTQSVASTAEAASSSSSPSSSSSYKPLLPKGVATSTVVVVNVSSDIASQSWEAKEALLATTVLQGLINREAADKVYLVHTPQEHDWTPWPADAYALEDGLLPVPHTNAQLLPPSPSSSSPSSSSMSRFPALAWMLRRALASGVLRGVVLVPSFSPPNITTFVGARVMNHTTFLPNPASLDPGNASTSVDSYESCQVLLQQPP